MKKNILKSILLWSAIVGALFLLASWLLMLGGLQFRIWIREPVTIIVGFGLAAGILQLLLRIKKKAAKVVAIILWTAAFIAAGAYGFFIYALTCRYETSQNTMYDGKRCIVEHEPELWTSHELYYEYKNLFVHGSELLYED
jgi:hypothetical protein